MILEILWQILTGIETSLEFCMCNVACHNYCTLKVDTCADRILRKFLAHFINTTVEIDDNATAFTCLLQFCRNQLCWVVVHLLEPYTVGIYLSLDVTVGRATHSHADGA